MKLQCKKFVDNYNKPGRGKMPRPDFFNELSEIIGSSHSIQPLHTLETMASAAEPQPSTSHESTEADTPQSSQPVAGSMRKLKPPSSKERLEEKLDKLIKQQAAAQQISVDQFNSMVEQSDKQQADRMKMMSGLINAVVWKGKGKIRRSADTESDDS